MALDLTYKLDDAGWASVSIRDGQFKIDLAVSYLHDSLRELAEAAISIRDGSPTAEVVFMDEPGESHLVLSLDDDGLLYELRRYNDWCSWGNAPKDGFEVLHQGRALEWEFLACIRRQLAAILKEHGEDGYFKSWIEHPFPVDLYNDLLNKSQAEQASGQPATRPESK
jgi:hypothetical protein